MNDNKNFNGVLQGIICKPRHENIHDIFDDALLLSDFASIFVPGQGAKSYKYLKSRSLKVEMGLRELGLRKGDCVALFIKNSVDRIAAILATAKLGIVFVPLEHTLSRGRVSDMLKKCNVKFTLIANENQYKEVWNTYDLKDTVTVCLETLTSFAHKKSYNISNVAENEVQKVNGDDVLFILATSGSTGTPKCVQITHRNMINRLIWDWRTFPQNPNEVYCLKSSFVYFDYMSEMLSVILKCKDCVLLKLEQVIDVPFFLNIIHQYDITRIYVTPSFLKLLVSEKKRSKLILRIRYIFCCGESFPLHLAKETLGAFPDSAIMNLYGCTETTADILYKVIKNDDDLDNNIYNTPVGFPIANTICYLVNQEGCLIKEEDQVGEILVSGCSISPGYLNEVSQGGFDTNNFSDDPEFGCLYKTGDYAMFSQRGLIVLGRQDEFIKLRGQKVSLKEVESVFKEFFPRLEVCVLGRYIESVATKKLYVIYESNDMNENDLKVSVHAVLRRQLPLYMCPILISVDKIPLLDTSSKVDRQALYQKIDMVENTNAQTHWNDYDKCKSAKEKFVHITSDVLNLKLKVDDLKLSFFQLGGTSLTAVSFLHNLNVNGFNLKLCDITNAISLNSLLAKKLINSAE